MNNNQSESKNNINRILRFSLKLKYGELVMNMKAITTGVTAGAAIGLAFYAFSSASMMKKHSIKKNAGKTLKAAGNLIDDITSMMR